MQNENNINKSLMDLSTKIEYLKIYFTTINYIDEALLNYLQTFGFDTDEKNQNLQIGLSHIKEYFILGKLNEIDNLTNELFEKTLTKEELENRKKILEKI